MVEERPPDGQTVGKPRTDTGFGVTVPSSLSGATGTVPEKA
jgi:hypothetical protein